MDCPAFTVIQYGVFDSRVKFPKITTTEQRTVPVFELEFYSADQPGTAYIDGRGYPLKCGSLICAKPGQVRNSKLPFKCFYVHLRTQDEMLRRMLQDVPEYLVLQESQELMYLFHEMLSVESADLPKNRLLLQSCICRILHFIGRQTRIPDHGDADRVLQHQRRLLRVEKYIREHLSEALSLTLLAGLCNLSPTYFHRLFTNFFSKTPAQYILDCRIAAAKTGLLADDCSLPELAADCGFSSQTYFCYKFKQATGKTPLEYRREMLSRLKI